MQDPDWSLEDFKKHFHYCPETGVFTKIAPTGRNWRPGPVKPGARYTEFRFRGQLCRAHRAAFFYMTGEWPEADVDHRDGDKRNNRWTNLRQASRSQNLANQGARVGSKNIHPTPHGTWQVRVAFMGKEHTRTFKTLEEAEAHAANLRDSMHAEFSRHS